MIHIFILYIFYVIYIFILFNIYIYVAWFSSGMGINALEGSSGLGVTELLLGVQSPCSSNGTAFLPLSQQSCSALSLCSTPPTVSLLQPRALGLSRVETPRLPTPMDSGQEGKASGSKMTKVIS